MGEDDAQLDKDSWFISPTSYTEQSYDDDDDDELNYKAALCTPDQLECLFVFPSWVRLIYRTLHISLSVPGTKKDNWNADI